MKIRQMAKDIDEKIEELKEHIRQQLSVNNKNFEQTCEKLFQKFKNEFKEEFAKELKKRGDKIEKLEFDKAMLQKYILEIKKQNLTNRSEIEELEQYGRRQCLRFEGALTEQNETSDKVLSKIMDMCKEAGVDIPDAVIDRAHGIREAFFDNTRKKACKSFIVCFTTAHYRTMVYRAKKNMKNNMRVKLDLRKKRYNLLISANIFVANINSVKFCCAGINCRPKIKWSNDSLNDEFFHSLNQFKDMTNIDE